MTFKVEVKSGRLIAQLQKDFKHLSEKEVRGVVAVGANVIRDKAKSNAEAVGLGQTGAVADSSGRLRQRHGRIPGAIYAYVRKNEGDTVTARVALDTKAKRGPQQTFHARFIEFGTVHMSPRPFFRRSLAEAEGEALAAMEKRFAEAVGRMLR